MSAQQWLAVLGAAAGTIGSVLTAFSLNRTIRELNIARKGIEVTVEALASGQPNVPVFEGFDTRFDRAVRWGNRVVWIGVGLLAIGFILQASSVCTGP